MSRPRTKYTHFLSDCRAVWREAVGNHDNWSGMVRNHSIHTFVMYFMVWGKDLVIVNCKLGFSMSSSIQILPAAKVWGFKNLMTIRWRLVFAHEHLCVYTCMYKHICVYTLLQCIHLLIDVFIMIMCLINTNAKERILIILVHPFKGPYRGKFFFRPA